MSTDTLDNDTITPTDTALLTDYEAGASTTPEASSRKPLPPRGAYTLRLPEVFDVEPTKARNAVGIIFGANPLHPLVIADGEHAGYEMRFVRVYTTLSKGMGESSAGAVLRNFGVTREQLFQLYGSGSIAQWRDAFAQFAGQTTPSPVWCDWEGEDRLLSKTMREQGATNEEINKATRYRGMGPAKPGRGGAGRRFDQLDAQGQVLPYVELDWQAPGRDGTLRNVRIYARLVPTMLGFLPKDAK